MDGLEETAGLIKSAASSPNVQSLVVPTDVLHEKDVQHMVDETVRNFGRIDYAVNAAGTQRCLNPLNGGERLMAVRYSQQQREIHPNINRLL